jgi:hypothetical protein
LRSCFLEVLLDAVARGVQVAEPEQARVVAVLDRLLKQFDRFLAVLLDAAAA